MKRVELRRYCLAKPGAWLDEPWPGDEVVKVGSKIFAFLGAADAESVGVGLKCGRDAESARELRDRYPHDITVSPYVGRYGWNTVRLSGDVPDDEVLELVDASYESVVASLPKRNRP